MATAKKCMTSTRGRGFSPDSSDTGPAHPPGQYNAQGFTRSMLGAVLCSGHHTKHAGVAAARVCVVHGRLAAAAQGWHEQASTDWCFKCASPW